MSALSPPSTLVSFDSSALCLCYSCALRLRKTIYCICFTLPYIFFQFALLYSTLRIVSSTTLLSVYANIPVYSSTRVLRPLPYLGHALRARCFLVSCSSSFLSFHRSSNILLSSTPPSTWLRAFRHRAPQSFSGRHLDFPLDTHRSRFDPPGLALDPLEIALGSLCHPRVSQVFFEPPSGFVPSPIRKLQFRRFNSFHLRKNEGPRERDCKIDPAISLALFCFRLE